MAFKGSVQRHEKKDRLPYKGDDPSKTFEYRKGPGVKAEPYLQGQIPGKELSSYEEDWTDWPSQLARTISDSFVKRFGGSNISRREGTEQFRQVMDFVPGLGAAKRATEVYETGRSGHVGKALNEAISGSVEETAGKAAGIFFAPRAVMAGSDKVGLSLAEGARDMMRKGKKEAEIRDATGIHYLRGEGDYPNVDIPALEMPMRNMTYDQMPRYDRMWPREELERQLEIGLSGGKPRAIPLYYPRFHELVNSPEYMEIVGERYANLPITFSMNQNSPIEAMTRPEILGGPYALSLQPEYWGKTVPQFGRPDNQAMFPEYYDSTYLIHPNQDETLYRLGTTMQDIASQVSGWSPRTPWSTYRDQLGEYAGEIPPTHYATLGKPETGRIMQGLWDRHPDDPDLVSAMAYQNMVPESLSRAAGYRMPLGFQDTLDIGIDKSMEAMQDVTQVDQIDPASLFSVAQSWRGAQKPERDAAMDLWMRFQDSRFRGDQDIFRRFTRDFR